MFLNSVVLHLASCFPDDPKDGGDSERPLGGGLPKWISKIEKSTVIPPSLMVLLLAPSGALIAIPTYY